MSLLQQVLDKIEAEAAKKSAVAAAHADTLRELEALAETLRANGAGYFSVVPSIHAHYGDLFHPDAVSARIVVYTDHARIFEALAIAGLPYTLEPEDREPGRTVTALRLSSTRAWIDLYDWPETQEAA